MQLPDSPYLEIIIVFIFLLLVALFLSLILRRRKKTPEDNAYQKALEHLADGQLQQALDKFKEAVRQDTGNISAYLRLGDLLRQQGLIKNALRIHKELTLRENLTREENLKIHESLLRDYEAAGDLQKGILIARKIMEMNKADNSWAAEKLIDLYVRAGNWQEAIDATKKYFKPLSTERKKELAGYLVSQGLQKLKEGRGKEGRIKFKEAIKIYPQCKEAYYHLGKSYLEENRLEDAVRQWRKFCFEVPQEAHIVFPLLEKASFEMGKFSDVENLYIELLALETKNLKTLLALAEFYIKKGKLEKALSLLENADSELKESPEVAAKKVEVLYQMKMFENASEEALRVLQERYAGEEQLEKS
ncbi:MAG: tetratricopeptide repeat protein, partial [Calditrichia bacterium]